MKIALFHRLFTLILLTGFVSLTNSATAQPPSVRSAQKMSWFKSRDAQKRPERGLLSGRLERRKAARKAKTASAIKAASPKAPKTKLKKKGASQAAKTPTKVKSPSPVDAPPQARETARPNKKVVRAPGRPGRGTGGMIKRRRSVLKPLFGD